MMDLAFFWGFHLCRHRSRILSLRANRFHLFFGEPEADNGTDQANYSKDKASGKGAAVVAAGPQHYADHGPKDARARAAASLPAAVWAAAAHSSGIPCSMTATFSV